jgi:hypothetical protein
MGQNNFGLVKYKSLPVKWEEQKEIGEEKEGNRRDE